LAAVLWNGGISFGGVVSFIFADLLIIPILLIYRRYYGTRMALLLFGTFYATMVVAGYLIELVFDPLGLIPTGPRTAFTGEEGITLNYTTVLNVVFLLVAVALLWRFFATGGRPMLAMMGGSPDEMAEHDCGDDHQHHG
ncbi:MAG: permease, partial [Actinomycetota bacterium]